MAYLLGLAKLQVQQLLDLAVVAVLVLTSRNLSCRITIGSYYLRLLVAGFKSALTRFISLRRFNSCKLLIDLKLIDN